MLTLSDVVRVVGLAIVGDPRADVAEARRLLTEMKAMCKSYVDTEHTLSLECRDYVDRGGSAEREDCRVAANTSALFCELLDRMQEIMHAHHTMAREHDDRHEFACQDMVESSRREAESFFNETMDSLEELVDICSDPGTTSDLVMFAPGVSSLLSAPEIHDATTHVPHELVKKCLSLVRAKTTSQTYETVFAIVKARLMILDAKLKAMDKVRERQERGEAWGVECELRMKCIAEDMADMFSSQHARETAQSWERFKALHPMSPARALANSKVAIKLSSFADSLMSTLPQPPLRPPHPSSSSSLSSSIYRDVPIGPPPRVGAQ